MTDTRSEAEASVGAIDPKYEFDAPTFVDFGTMSGCDEDADRWFDSQAEQSPEQDAPEPSTENAIFQDAVVDAASPGEGESIDDGYAVETPPSLGDSPKLGSVSPAAVVEAQCATPYACTTSPPIATPTLPTSLPLEPTPDMEHEVGERVMSPGSVNEAAVSPGDADDSSTDHSILLSASAGSTEDPADKPDSLVREVKSQTAAPKPMVHSRPHTVRPHYLQSTASQLARKRSASKQSQAAAASPVQRRRGKPIRRRAVSKPSTGSLYQRRRPHTARASVATRRVRAEHGINVKAVMRRSAASKRPRTAQRTTVVQPFKLSTSNASTESKRVEPQADDGSHAIPHVNTVSETFAQLVNRDIESSPAHATTATSITVPITPKLATARLARHKVLSTEERQVTAMQQRKPFTARKLSQAVLNGDGQIKRKRHRGPTKVRAFRLLTQARTHAHGSISAEPEAPRTFKARALPKSIYGSEGKQRDPRQLVHKKVLAQRHTIEAHAPTVALRVSKKPQGGDKLSEKHLIEFEAQRRARALKKRAKPFKLATDSRGSSKTARFFEKVDTQRSVAQHRREFTARPILVTAKSSQEHKKQVKVTRPAEFNLRSVHLSKYAREQWRRRVESQQLQEAAAMNQFRAKPVPKSLYKPVMARKAAKPRVEPAAASTGAVRLASQDRAARRRAFDERQRARLAALDAEREEMKRAEEEKKAAERIRIRRRQRVKARAFPKHLFAHLRKNTQDSSAELARATTRAVMQSLQRSESSENELVSIALSSTRAVASPGSDEGKTPEVEKRTEPQVGKRGALRVRDINSGGEVDVKPTTGSKSMKSALSAVFKGKQVSSSNDTGGAQDENENAGVGVEA